jgi:Core-2/I-Branching enzyme
MKLACVILAHRDPSQVQLLLQAIEHEQVRPYLHVDSRVDVEPFVVPGVSLLPRHPTRWGGPELVDAVLDGLAQAVRDGCDYVVLVTGEGYPLRPIEEIVAFFTAHPTRNYGEYGPLPERARYRTECYSYTVRGKRELCIPWGGDTSMFGVKGHALNWALRLRSLPKGKRRFPSYLEPYGGRLWWNLSREAAQYILEFNAEHPDYRRYHEHTWCPDELFFCSIMAHSGLEIVNDTLRYYVWGKTARSAVTQPDEIPAAIQSGALFAQKTAPETVERLAKLIGVRVA